MAGTESTNVPPSRPRTTIHDATFRNYTPESAARYAAHRLAYSQALIDLVLKAHTSTGGKLLTLLDVGCGPGLATQQLAPYFQHVIGADPGQSMIETARAIQPPLVSAAGEPVRFEICSAEEIDTLPGVDKESVDVITAATAAHWFDLPYFYAAASKILKPNGTILFWTSGKVYVNPETTPNAAAVQKTWEDVSEKIAGPYKNDGNRRGGELYSKIDLPWTIHVPPDQPDLKDAFAKFDESASWRETFNADGKKDDRLEGGYMRRFTAPIDRLLKAATTQGMVTRWREAHKEQLERGEIEDCIVTYNRVTREALAGVEGGEHVNDLDVFTATGLVVIKKKA